MNIDKPWDARLAYYSIYPLRNTWITPNHVTSIRLLFGIIACMAFASGDALNANLGAICFVISSFLDHADGELARMTDKMSKSGHNFDLICDALVNILLFIGIGIGLMHGIFGYVSVIIGCIASISVAAIYYMRNEIEKRVGKTNAKQPHAGGFEAEDVLYLIPVITIADGLLPFLLLAGIGTPLFALWVLNEYLTVLDQK